MKPEFSLRGPLVTLVTVCLAGLSSAASAQDLCAGLVTDKARHSMTALAKPALGQTVTDPQFGTTIRRITAVAAGGSIKPMYSTISAWNADETRLILYRVGSGHQLYDGKTYQFIKNLAINPADLEQVYWHTIDPDLLFYVDGNRFIRYHVSSGVKDTLTTFTFCSSASGGDDPMYISWDSRRIGLGCGSERFIYDMSTNTIVGRKTMSGDEPQVAPSGNLAFLDGDVLDANLDFVRALDLGNPSDHASLGRTASGNDAYFGVAFDEGPAGSGVGSLVLHDMTNGTWRVIVGPDTGYPYPPSGTHVSAMAHKRPGWVTVSIVGNTSGQNVLDNEILLANTAPGGSVCRVAHHRSFGKASAQGYWAEPHAVPSPSGSRILFGSDWGNSGSVDAYVIELPSYGGSGRDGDLSLTASASPSPVALGSQITYTLTVRNEGSTSISGVILTDTLPSNTTFVSASSGCTHASGTVTCSLGTLAASATRNVTLTVATNAVGTAVNQANVSGVEPDPDTTNNSATNSVPVLPTVSIGDAIVTEGNSGTTTAQFLVSLSAGSSSTVTVGYATANGTATAGSDYVAKSGTLTFTPGSVQQTIAVTVNGDTTVEPNETFFVNLSGPSGAILADAQGQGTITNDDTAALPTLSINDVTVAEGHTGTTNAAFTVTLSAASSSTVTVSYATANGTATAGSDYVAQTGNLSFTAGQTSKTITVAVNGDTTVEPNETFVVNLSSASGATIVDAQGLGTITNDDTPPPPPGAEPVVWTSAVGVSVSGNSLTKTAANAWGNAGAISTQQIASGEGYVEITASETNTYRMIGLSNGNTNASYEDIDFALYLALGQLRVYENGTSKGTFGNFATGDKLRVAVVGGAVKYSRNGSVFYNSTKVPTYPLLVDTALYNQSATLSSAVIASGSGTPPPPPGSEPVVWTSAVGVSVSGSSLTKTAANAWGNAGATSTQQIAAGEGYVEITASETNTYRMIGLSNGNTNASYEDIDFALYLALGQLRVYENGTSKGTFGSFAAGDKLRVAVVGGVVKYSRNGSVFYSSTKTPTYPLLVDTALYTQSATLSSAVIGGAP